jgi:hypothetical protein
MTRDRVLFGGVLALALASCSVDRSRSPVCGMALLVGPNIILQQMGDARALLTEAPRGLPAALPVRVVGQADTTEARVSGDLDHLALNLNRNLIPAVTVDSTGRDSSVFGVLLVDDSTAIVRGVLIYEGERPSSGYPRVGTLVDSQRTVPLYGLRVSWQAVSNPRCPLLGNPTAE